MYWLVAADGGGERGFARMVGLMALSVPQQNLRLAAVRNARNSGRRVPVKYCIESMWGGICVGMSLFFARLPLMCVRVCVREKAVSCDGNVRGDQ